MKRRKTTILMLLAMALLGFALVATGCGDSGSDDNNTGGDQDTIDNTTDGDQTDNVTDGDEQEETTSNTCLEDSDCPEGKACNDETLECMDAQCESDSECNEGHLCGEYDGRYYDCSCGGDTLCYAKKCSVSADCSAGYVCEGGKCLEAIPASDVDHVALNTSSFITRSGITVALTAVAYNSNGAIISNSATDFEWSSSDDSIVSVADGVATGGDTDGTATITATFKGSDKSASVDMVNFAEVESGKVRVIVTNIRTGEFVEGATVILNDVEQTTDANGSAVFDGATAPYNVHVFSNDFMYVSAFGLDTNDIFLPLEPVRDNTKCGGVKGKVDFSTIPERLKEDIKLAISAMQISGNLLDIDFMSLIGENINSHVKLGNIVDDYYPIPSGIELYISRTAVREGYMATGPEGPGVLWSFGGYLPLADVISIASDAMGGGSVEDIQLGQLLPQIMAYFDDFYHGIKSGLNVELYDKVQDTEDINGNEDTEELVCDFSKFPDLGGAPSLDQNLGYTANLHFSSLPTFPGAANNEGAGVLAVMGADVTGIGIVPLGLTIGLDEDEDGNTDGKVGDNGNVVMHYAPQHGGIHDYNYFLLAAALDVNGLIASKGKGDVAFGAVLKMFDAPPENVELSNFPSFVSYNFDTTARTVEISGDNASGDFVRVLMTGDDGKQWAVYMKVGESVTLPAVPNGMTDRIATEIKDLYISGIDLSGDLDYDGLMQFNDKNLNQLNYITDAFSVIVPNPSD